MRRKNKRLRVLLLGVVVLVGLLWKHTGSSAGNTPSAEAATTASNASAATIGSASSVTTASGKKAATRASAALTAATAAPSYAIRKPAQSAFPLDVPYLSQVDYPTGCESISAVMLLQYWGAAVTVDEFIDRYLECGQVRDQNGEAVGPSPNDKFVGDPHDDSGYGCYAPVIQKAFQNMALDGGRARNLTDSSLAQLCEQYIDNGIPVLIWATIGMENSYPSSSWIDEKTGETVQWLANEHCMVLVGYDEDAYYCNDPYNGNGVMRYARWVLEDRYAQMGYQAVAIVPTNN